MTILIVLPGLDGTATLHSAFVKAVASAFEKVRVVSYPPDQQLDYCELEKIARAALPATQPFVLLGESFSGPIAISIAADAPENMRGLVLSTSFAKSPVKWAKTLAHLVRLAPMRLLPMFALSWWLYGEWANSALRVSLHSALNDVAPAVLRMRAVQALRVDVSHALRSISVPVLYLRAAADHLLGPGNGNYIASRVSHCTLVDVPGPHLLLQASPVPCAQAVQEFASRIFDPAKT